MQLTTHPFEDDKLHEECGVFGIVGSEDAAAHTALGLHSLQHRGQEAAGIVAFDGQNFNQRKAFGKVGDNFGAEEVIAALKGNAAIGHNRYSTSGTKQNGRNIQPLYADYHFGGLALAHNGNLTNAASLRKELIAEGSIFHTTMDTEVVMHLIARSNQQTVLDRVVGAMQKIKGAYSMVVLTEHQLIAARDPHGVRPLVLGKLDDAFVVASESCAFDIMGAEIIRDVEPGEVIIIEQGVIRSLFPLPETPKRFCVFEYVYFSRPDSFIEGKDVYEARQHMGAELARENAVDADMVIPVPDSGVPAALGYAQAANIPVELGIIRNHYVGRTFIEPTDSIRHLGVKLKHNANARVIKGKRVVLVDDSIVRGTTSKKIVDMVRAAGAKEVHMRISSPPTTDSCFYGVDTPSKEKLLASKMRVEEMAQFIGADSLAFLSVDAMYRAVGEAEGRNNAAPQFCDACFTGDYPISIDDTEHADTLLFG